MPSGRVTKVVRHTYLTDPPPDDPQLGGAVCESAVEKVVVTPSKKASVPFPSVVVYAEPEDIKRLVRKLRRTKQVPRWTRAQYRYSDFLSLNQVIPLEEVRPYVVYMRLAKTADDTEEVVHVRMPFNEGLEYMINNCGGVSTVEIAVSLW